MELSDILVKLWKWFWDPSHQKIKSSKMKGMVFKVWFRYLTIYQEATDIYGLIHARFILTPKGLAMMKEKYLKGVFGVCPRVLCERQHVLPIGMSEEIRTSRVKVFCPRCEEVYMPKKKCHDVDGAYFGCSFANILLMVLINLTNRYIQTSSQNHSNQPSSPKYMASKSMAERVPNIVTKRT